MLIEVAGVFTENKGAELMLVAVQQHFAQVDPRVRLAVSPQFGSFEERARYGLHTRLPSRRPGRSTLAAWLMPGAFRSSYGLAAERDIDAVLDASGFAFSDQLGPERTERFAAEVARWKRAGKKIVLLPQALGPFQTSRVRRAFAEVMRSVDLVFARDPESLAHVQQLGVALEKLRLAPDFTNLVLGCRPELCDLAPSGRLALIVPNRRMVEKTTPELAAAYLPTLATCVQELQKHGLTPVILLHDAGVDETLVAPLQQRLPQPLPVVREADPRRLKGLLGVSQAVVGSRFHALVGALSQGVPSVALGWSHKYVTLLADYGCSECLLSPAATADEVRQVVGQVAGGAATAELRARLHESAALQRRRTEEMWALVDKSLAMHPQPASQGSSSARAVAAGVLPC